MSPTSGSVLLGSSVVAVVTTLVVGLFLMGTPNEERARRVDGRRVADLEAIVAATDLYWTRHSRLPMSLNELTGEPGVTININDPSTAETYGYQSLDSLGYELCAEFETESGETLARPAADIWAHGAGRQCFRLEAQQVKRN